MTTTATALLQTLIRRFDEVHDRHDIAAVDRFLSSAQAIFGAELTLQLIEMMERRQLGKQ
jgi:hypothetical protein